MRAGITSALLVLCSWSCGPSPESEPGRAGIVFVVVDTLRADHVLGGARAAHTPRLDALAEEGVVFTRARSHTATTLPSHLSMFSSRLPSLSGTSYNGQAVEDRLPLLAEHLRELGWDTRAVVSIGALRPLELGHGVDRGFEQFDIELLGLPNAENANGRLAPVLDELALGEEPFFLFAHYADPHMPLHAHGTVSTPLSVRAGGELLERVDIADLSEWERRLPLPADGLTLELELADERQASFALQLLRAQRGQESLPTELVGAELNEPVRSLVVQVENPSGEPGEVSLSLWMHEYISPAEGRRRYALEVEYVDRWLGELFDGLRARGLWERSTVVFTSDHGEGLGDHGDLGHGKSLWEEQLRVPLVVRLSAQRGQDAAALRERSAAPVGHIDLVPTLLELYDLPALPEQNGHSLLSGAPKLHFAEAWAPGHARVFSASDARWKLMYSPDIERFLLYDLEADPAELDDLYAVRGSEFAERAAALREHASAALRREELFAARRASGGALTPEQEAELRALGY